MKHLSVFAKILLSALCGALAFASCIKDDLSNCPPPYNVQLHIITDADAGGFPANPTPDFDRYAIDSVTLYIFDGAGTYLSTWSGGAYPDGTGYNVPLQLAPGEYQFAAVTNQGGLNYMDPATPAQTTAADLRMHMALPEGGFMTDDVSALCLGTLGMHAPDSPQSRVTVVEKPTEGENDFTLILHPQTYKINFKIIGLPADGMYSINAADHNFIRTLDNTLSPVSTQADSIRYTRMPEIVSNASQPTMQTSMTVYNLDKNVGQPSKAKQMPFTLNRLTSAGTWPGRNDTNDGTPIYPADLIDLINTAYINGTKEPADFSTTFEFDIVLVFAGADVSVTVNDWEYNKDTHKLQ